MSRRALFTLRTALRVAPAPRRAAPLARPAAAPSAPARGKSHVSTRTPGRGNAPRPRVKYVPLATRERFVEICERVLIGHSRGNGGLYYKCIEEWQLALQRGPRGTEDPNLLTHIGASLQEFHEAALLASGGRITSTGRRNTAIIELAFSMLLYASSRGHDPSTLSYISIALELDRQAVLRPATWPPELEARLETLTEQNDAHAVILSARLAAHRGDDETALRLFTAATEPARRSDKSIQWMATALVGLGHAHKRSGNAEAAREAFLAAAKGHNDHRAWLEVAYDGDCPEDVFRLERAAMIGDAESAVKVADAQSEVALKRLEAGDNEGFMDHSAMAQEWLKLAGVKEPADFRAERSFLNKLWSRLP